MSYLNSTMRNLMTIAVACLLAGLSMLLQGCGSSASAEAQPPLPPVSVVYESVIEVHWSSGIQTSHYMFGPHPGTGGTFIPTPDWRYALRAATAHSIGFFFNYPTIQVNKAVWRLVWLPQKTKARLLMTIEDRGAASDIETEVVQFNTTRNDSVVQQDAAHPIDMPRVVDVDITEAFNQAITSGHFTQFAWQVKE